MDWFFLSFVGIIQTLACIFIYLVQDDSSPYSTPRLVDDVPEAALFKPASRGYCGCAFDSGRRGRGVVRWRGSWPETGRRALSPAGPQARGDP